MEKRKKNIEICLKDAGCQDEMIEDYMKCLKYHDYQKQIILLKRQKCFLLENLHNTQKQIDCLDYLIYQLKKEGGKENE